MATVWELDFYSRPILDEQQKKLWELVVCESPLDTRRAPESLFRYAQFCPSSQVNSAWLRTALEEAISKAPAPPAKIRFFRRQMNNMILKACQELGLDAKPSRHTIALHRWLQQRMQEVYPKEAGFQLMAPAASVRMESPAPRALPDALVGQKWAFVTLEASAFEEMHEWEIDFGEAFPILGEHSLVPQLTPETPIPGLIIFSPRALALAGWISGLELAFLKVDLNSPARIVLETGASDRWILANLTNPQLQAEAKGFDDAKQKAQMVHFLAVQSSPQSESFAGFWLLEELNLS